MSKFAWVLLVLSALWLLIVKCSQITNNTGEQNTYLNLSDSATYVGMETCKSCHFEIYQSFTQTGMGQSLGDANRQKSAATINEHSKIYDSLNNLYYQPFFKDDKLFISEYRLKGKDTVHSRLEAVDFIIGSGQHTNSHIMQVNGYLYQMPMTFYTQSQKWDFPPGFANNNSRFSRALETECLTCHNAYPQVVPKADHKYHVIPKGIDCERCHGPGSIHVAQKAKGIKADTSKGPDWSIVNPRRLSYDLQVAICSRCHLQGNAVLKDGKTFFDFKPGMPLSEVMSVFLPRFEGGDEEFIMASHADRMSLSACFIKSNKQMSCITCHNPHKSITITPDAHYNQKCNDCHKAPKQLCTESETNLAKHQYNCVSCHMPKSSATDIPHVQITDHWIKKPGKSNGNQNQVKKFVRLASINESNPSSLIKAKAYIQYYEKFESKDFYLDSAKNHLLQVNEKNKTYFEAWINYAFLKNDYTTILQKVQEGASFGKALDAWSHYRIAEAYLAFNNTNEALEYLQIAVNEKPYQLDFRMKLAAAQAKTNQIQAAIKNYMFVISENPKLAKAHANVGYLYLLQKNPTLANQHYNIAIKLDPDYEAAWLNKVGLLIFEGKIDEAKKLLLQLKIKFPNNKQIEEVLNTLYDKK